MSPASSRRWWTIGALVPAVLAGGLDVIVLNLALPTLAEELAASAAELQWFVAAYSLAFAAALLPGGMLGDRFGRRRMLLIGLVIFGVASVACAFAPSSSAFIAARAALGIGAAVILPMVLGVLPVVFSVDERPKAVAIVTAATAGGIAIGPILGGWLLTNYWWGSVFLINVPVVILALVAVAAWLPESRSAQRRRPDLLGVLASSAGLASLTYGLIQAGQNGWSDGGTLAPVLVGIVVLVGFVLWQRRVRDPLVDLALFRSPSFAWGIVFATLVSFLMYAVIFAAPQYFQAVLGVDAQGSGLRLLPLVGGLFVGATIAQRLAARIGAKTTVAAGFVMMAAGLFLGATTSVASDDGFALAWIGLSGLGVGFALPTAMDAALGALSVERSGVGSAVIQAARMVGTTFGVALLGSVLTATYRDRVDVSGLPAEAAEAVRDSVAAGMALAQQIGSAPLLDSVRAAFVEGMDLMLLANGAIAAGGLALALLFLPRRSAAPRPSDPRPAEAREAPAA
jgi:EmrB/QacA subfamily drug resistance transporter